jgi:hypothetical protein
MRAKELLQRRAIDVVAEIPDIQLLAHVLLLMSWACDPCFTFQVYAKEASILAHVEGGIGEKDCGAEMKVCS